MSSNVFSKGFDRYIDTVIARPKLVLSLIGLLLVVAIAGLPRFKLDASSEALTLKTDTALDFYREIAKRYDSGDFLVVTFEPRTELFSDESLALLDKLREELSSVTGVKSVTSMLDVPLLYSPKRGIVDSMRDTRTLLTPGVDRDLVRQEFLTSPVYRNLILSPDAQTTALQINFDVDTQYIDLVQRRDALRYMVENGSASAAQSLELEQVSQEFLAYRTKSEAKSHERVEAVRQIVAKYQDQAQMFVGGVSMITADMIQFIRSDLVVFGSASLLFMIIVLIALFRQLRFVVIPMLTCISSVVLMLGLISWLDWRLTVISSNFVALLLIISLAIIIHLIVRYREYERDYPEWGKARWVKAACSFMAKPCLYTTLTTMVAFASLVVSDIKPVIDFGWMMTMGLVVALILAFTLLPACLMLTKDNARASAPTRSLLPTAFFARQVEKRSPIILGAGVMLAVFSVVGIGKLTVENKFIDYFHQDTEIYKGLSVIDNELGGTTTLSIILNAPQEEQGAQDEQDGFADAFDTESPYDQADPFAADAGAVQDETPSNSDTSAAGFESDTGDAFDTTLDDAFDDAFAEPSSTSTSEQTANSNGDLETYSNYWMTVAGLKRIEAIHDYLEARPEVGNVRSLATLYKLANDIAGPVNDFELAIMEKSINEDLKKEVLSPFYAPEVGQTRISLRIKDLTPDLKRVALLESIRSDILNQGLVEPEEIKFTGLLVLYNNLLSSLFSSQIQSLTFVFIAIFVMFLILFRSLYLALLGILPNILSAGLTLGVMGWFGVPLDMMTIVVASVAVGIGVDNSIHYIYRYREELKQTTNTYSDENAIESVYRSHNSIGQALAYTSIIIVFGFSIMLFSKFIPTIYFGVLTGFAMIAALLAALLLLPVFLVFLARKRPASLA